MIALGAIVAADECDGTSCWLCTRRAPEILLQNASLAATALGDEVVGMVLREAAVEKVAVFSRRSRRASIDRLQEEGQDLEVKEAMHQHSHPH